jgi:hypothetical protein
MPEHDPKIKDDLDEYIAMKTGGGKPGDKPKDGKEDPKDKPKEEKKPAPPAGEKPKAATPPAKTDRIPLPDYKDPESRKKYAQEFHKKYGDLTEGRGDTPLRINEKPYKGSDTAKNLSTAAAKKVGLDPALFYSSAMEEGMSGIFPDDKGNVKFSGDKDFPISGLWTFGLDSFDKGKFNDLVKKGYLDKDFEQNFKVYEKPGGSPAGDQYKPEKSLFKTADAGIQAKAAMMKESYDDIEAYAKKKGIPLSAKARDFFALADFNGGEGVGHQMLVDYANNGLLKDDAFMKKRPTSGKGLKESSYKDVYPNIKRRLVMAEALKKEGYFDEDTTTAQ